MSADPTRIKVTVDPTVQRMTGVTNHGFMPFDVPFISEITPGLWQGGCKNGLILPQFIKHVVSLYPWESYRARHDLASNVAVRLLDSEKQDTGMISEIARWVARCKGTGPVLVHCQAGLNRSSLVVARVLMLEGATADEAIRAVREKRSPASLCNPAFEQWLRDQEPPSAVAMTTQDVNRFVGARICELRSALGMRQGELAARVGMSRAWVSLTEAGSRGLSAVRLVAVAAALGVQPGDLLPVVVPSG